MEIHAGITEFDVIGWLESVKVDCPKINYSGLIDRIISKIS
jgi:hypothetical protein